MANEVILNSTARSSFLMGDGARWLTRVHADLRERRQEVRITGLDRHGYGGRFCGVDDRPVFSCPPRTAPSRSSTSMTRAPASIAAIDRPRAIDRCGGSSIRPTTPP